MCVCVCDLGVTPRAKSLGPGGMIFCACCARVACMQVEEWHKSFHETMTCMS